MVEMVQYMIISQYSQPYKPDLLALSRVNIVGRYIYLYVFGIGYGSEIIEERADEFFVGESAAGHVTMRKVLQGLTGNVQLMAHILGFPP